MRTTATTLTVAIPTDCRVEYEYQPPEPSVGIMEGYCEITAVIVNGKDRLGDLDIREIERITQEVELDREEEVKARLLDWEDRQYDAEPDRRAGL